MEWYEKASKKVLAKLATSDWVDGGGFLRDFLSDSDEDYLDMDEEEDQEQYIIDALEGFENHLKKKFSSKIEVSKNFRWLNKTKQSEVSKNEVGSEAEIISESDNEILSKNISDLSKEEIKRCNNLSKLLRKENRFDDCSHFAKRYYEILERRNGTASEKLAVLSLLIDDAKNLHRVDLHELHCNKAEIYADNLKHSDAAIELKCALDHLILKPSLLEGNVANLNEITKDIFHRCRIQYEKAGRREEASEIYVKESKYVQSKLKLGFERGFMFIFWVLTKYGESPVRVFLWSVAIIFVWSIIYMYAGVNSPAGPDWFHCEQTVDSAVIECKELEASSELGYGSYLYYSVVTFTTLGYGDFSPQEGMSRFFSAFQAVLGLFFASLFLVIFVKKYSR